MKIIKNECLIMMFHFVAFIFRLPNVEMSSRANNVTVTSANKNPYSFAPTFKAKKLPQTSDGCYGETSGKYFSIFGIQTTLMHNIIFSILRISSSRDYARRISSKNTSTCSARIFFIAREKAKA